MELILTLILVFVTSAFGKDCSSGESYWCANINNAKECGAVQKCMSSVWKHHDLSNMEENDVCQYCEQFIGDVRAHLDNQTEEQIIQFLNEACSLIPDESLAEECKQQVEKNVAEIFDMIRQSLDPQSVCSAMGLCTGFKNLLLRGEPLFKTKVGGDVCSDCKAFITDLADMIDSNETESEVEDLLKQVVCGYFGEYQAECNAAVESYTPEIMQLLSQTLDPERVCESFGVCTGGKFNLETLFLAPDMKSTEFCPVCKMAAQSLKGMLVNHQSDVVNFIVQNICSELGSEQQQCKEDVELFVPIVFQYIAQVDPDTVCVSLGLCDKKISLESVHKPKPEPHPVQNVKQSTECILCEFIMKELEEQIGDNATEAEIVKALDKVCSVLPDTISQECKSFIDQYGKAILIILKDELDPQTVCTTLGLCSQRAKVKPVVGGGELCGVCQTVIQYIDSLLEENATVQEIEAAVKKVCNMVPDPVKSECDDFISEYGPMIIQLLVEAADPTRVCTELQLCTGKLSPVIEPIIQPRKAQLVGVNECTYGPAYWCASYENAKKCKATKHCITHVWKNGVPGQ